MLVISRSSTPQRRYTSSHVRHLANVCGSNWFQRCLRFTSMSERVKRLEEKGIIEGYGARIDYHAPGLGMLAIIRLRATHEHIKVCL